MDYGLKDLCKAIVNVTTGKQDPKPTDLCVTQDGLPLVGNTAATRPRLAVYGYDSTGKVKDAVIDSAFVAVVAEEDKGLGAFTFDADGNACTQDGQQRPRLLHLRRRQEHQVLHLQHVDHGHRRRLHAGHPAGQPDPARPPAQPARGGLGRPASSTRRGTPASSGISATTTSTSTTPRSPAAAVGWGRTSTRCTRTRRRRDFGLLALPTWKQGIMNQGGPADVMSRRIVMIRRNWKSLTRRSAATLMPSATWSAQLGFNPARDGQTDIPLLSRRPLPGFGHQPLGRDSGHLPGFGNRRRRSNARRST